MFQTMKKRHPFTWVRSCQLGMLSQYKELSKSPVAEI